MSARQMALDALRGSHKELLSVLDAINADKIPHDGDEFHERLAANIKAIAALQAELAQAVDRAGVFREIDGVYEHMADFYSGSDAVNLYTAPQEPAVNAELLEALKGVLRVADRKTDEFDAARAAIAKAEAT